MGQNEDWGFGVAGEVGCGDVVVVVVVKQTGEWGHVVAGDFDFDAVVVAVEGE